MEIIREAFLSKVKREIKHIKKHATEDEKSLLNFSDFNHTSRFECIYGQMTGECDSERALALYPKKYISCGGVFDYHIPFEKHSFEKGTQFTPLEKYLYMVKSDVHQHIIEYIRGEVNRLKIK